MPPPPQTQKTKKGEKKRIHPISKAELPLHQQEPVDGSDLDRTPAVKGLLCAEQIGIRGCDWRPFSRVRLQYWRAVTCRSRPLRRAATHRCPELSKAVAIACTQWRKEKDRSSLARPSRLGTVLADGVEEGAVEVMVVEEEAYEVAERAVETQKARVKPIGAVPAGERSEL